ncbi:MAG: cyclodeaminase/cyclohydrolase family protein [Phycisphaerae bacterium]|nr:cyclodeaminase/cyclohydrolase family protein [Phycisphaerae bacterium]
MPSESPNYFEEPLTRFLDDAAEATPTPGGGSVSSLAAALGTTMAQMSAGFTLKSKKYEQFHEAVKPIAEKLARAHEMLRRLVAEDIAAYGLYSEASKLPKDDPNKAEQSRLALTTAIAVPEEIVATAVAVLEEVERLVPVCNPWLLSDAGVAAVLCEAAARAASLNVRVNLAMLENKDDAKKMREQIDAELDKAKQIRKRIDAELAERF